MFIKPDISFTTNCGFIQTLISQKDMIRLYFMAEKDPKDVYKLLGTIYNRRQMRRLAFLCAVKMQSRPSFQAITFCHQR